MMMYVCQCVIVYCTKGAAAAATACSKVKKIEEDGGSVYRSTREAKGLKAIGHL